MSYLKGMIEEMQETEGKKHRKKKVIVCILAVLVLLTAGFLGYRVYANYKEEQFFKSVKLREIKVKPMTLKHKKLTRKNPRIRLTNRRRKTIPSKSQW